MNIIVLTGYQLRHRYFVSRLNSQFPLAAVGNEKFLYPSPSPACEEEREAWDWFFRQRGEYESGAFGPSDTLPAKNIPVVFRMRPGELNSRKTLDTIQGFDPDLIAVYGTGLLGKDLVERYGGRILNLHVGLPEYCRGSGCNFWPVHNGRMEFLGASVHLLERGIDTGRVLLSEKIDLDEDDDEQSLAGKTIILGTDLMVSAIAQWNKGQVRFQAETSKGNLFLMKSFTPQAVLKVKRMVESGRLKKMIQSYKRNSGREAGA